MLNVEGECGHLRLRRIRSSLNGECEGRGGPILERMLNCEGECYFNLHIRNIHLPKKKQCPPLRVVSF